MPIARKPKSTYKPAPEGLYQAVCCDVWDEWDEPNPFKDGQIMTKTRICWQLDLEDEEWARPYEVSQIYTLSLHEKAKLRQHLESWRGKKFTDDELEGFDLDDLIGLNCQIQVVHNIKDSGETYANVQAIVPVAKKVPNILVSDGYRRKAARDAEKAGKEYVEAKDKVPF